MKTILAAMSGGVDSAVTALLLQRAGCAVTGGTMRLCDDAPADAAAQGCSTPAAIADAAAACRRMGIPHLVFDFRDEFQSQVIDRFTAGYLRGETPNPCLDCNRYLKFGCLLRRAESLGLDGIATGHYARIAYDPVRARWTLRKGRDETKDQSYVLYAMDQAALARTLLPLGDYRKSEIRQLARKAGLYAAADRPDSQDICFISGEEYGDFIVRRTGAEPAPGNFVAVDGSVLGRHRGQLYYTLGQRRRLGVSAAARLYVLGKDLARNEILLGGGEALYPKAITVRALNWVSLPGLDDPLEAAVMTRYRSREARCRITPLAGNRAQVEFLTPQRAPTPGQAAVFYDGDLLLGGGVIEPW